MNSHNKIDLIGGKKKLFLLVKCHGDLGFRVVWCRISHRRFHFCTNMLLWVANAYSLSVASWFFHKNHIPWNPVGYPVLLGDILILWWSSVWLILRVVKDFRFLIWQDNWKISVCFDSILKNCFSIFVQRNSVFIQNELKSKHESLDYTSCTCVSLCVQLKKELLCL